MQPAIVSASTAGDAVRPVAWLAAAAAALIFGGVWMRRWLRRWSAQSGAETGNWTLQQLRGLLSQGQITQAEYDRLKRVAVANIDPGDPDEHTRTKRVKRGSNARE